MKKHPLNDILDRLAEEGVPEDVDLRAAVHSRLDASVDQPPKGRFVMKPRVIVIAALALLGVFLLTPQGGALAQSLFQFFTIADSDVIVLPTATPTTAVSETEEGLSPTQTPADQEVFWDISVSEAESLAGFKLREPASLPAGYSRDVIVYGSDTGSVTQIYKFHPYQSGELFTLTQSPALKVDVVGSSASVDVLQVGGRSVEVISGIWWEDEPGSGVEEWVDDSPVHTFRWEEDGVYITIRFWVQDTFSPAYLTEEDMLAMIEVVMGTRETFPEGTNLNNLRSIAEAEEVAGYAILEPTVLPEGFTFQYASYQPEFSGVILFYYHGEVTRNSSTKLLIYETPLEEYTQGVWDGYPPEAIEEVSFGGQTGTYVRGLIISGAYDPNLWQRLEWDTRGLHLSMRLIGEQTLMDQAQMVQVAESMTFSTSATSSSSMAGPFDSITAAETFSQIDIPKFPFPLPGFEPPAVYIGNNSIVVQYDALESWGGGSFLTLEMWEGDDPFSAGAWDSVPSDTVEMIQKDDFIGEYVSGHFAVSSGENTARWWADAPSARLRWYDSGWNYELQLSGETVPVEYLNKENMVVLARSLADPTVRLNTDEGLYAFANVADAEMVMGVRVVEPTFLPEGMRFSGVSVTNPGQVVTTWYKEKSAGRLSISQVALEALDALDISQNVENMAVEPIQVRAAEGWVGSVDDTVWVLWWPGEAYAYRVALRMDVPDWVTPLGLEDLLAIAESMK